MSFDTEPLADWGAHGWHIEQPELMQPADDLKPLKVGDDVKPLDTDVIASQLANDRLDDIDNPGPHRRTCRLRRLSLLHAEIEQLDARVDKIEAALERLSNLLGDAYAAAGADESYCDCATIRPPEQAGDKSTEASSCG